ncbi:MAG: hypothetical protein K4571_10150 [Deltaproteobacteria bacterium]
MPDKQIKYFIIISAALIALAFLMAWQFDSFATGIVMFIAGGYFIYKIIKSLMGVFRNQERRKNLIIVAGSLVALVLVFQAFFISDHGLRELTEHRKRTLHNIRAVLLKYRTDQGCYPPRIADLVPDYIAFIPKELGDDDQECDPHMRITYKMHNGEATFHFHGMHLPDSGIIYHVSAGEFVYE